MSDLGVAVTVCEVPSANLPPPLTVPSALGEALTSSHAEQNCPDCLVLFG
jgi:hypothetical protein